jgi:hypothetical protein
MSDTESVNHISTLGWSTARVVLLVIVVISVMHLKSQGQFLVGLTTAVANDSFSSTSMTTISRETMDTMRMTSPCSGIVLPDWIRTMNYDIEKQIFSQFGEDGVIEYLLQHVFIPHKFYVEFGTESGIECNTRVLLMNHGWKGLLMDGGNENSDINLHREFILPDTIVSLLQKYGLYPNATDEIGYFSEDTDYADYFIWRTIFRAGYRPRLLVSEVNSNFLPNESGTVHAPDPGTLRMWQKDHYFGLSALALQRLWNQFGYIVRTKRSTALAYARICPILQSMVMRRRHMWI